MKLLSSNRYALVAFMALTGLLINACGKRTEAESSTQTPPKASEANTEIEMSAEAAKIGGIEIGEARLSAIQGQLQVPGVVGNTSNGRAIVTSPTGGKIINLTVGVGDQVKRGQVIAIIQSADLAKAAADVTESQRVVITANGSIRESEAEVNLALSHLKSARAVLERQRDLAKAGAFSQPSLQEARKAFDQAEAEYDKAVKEDVAHNVKLARYERMYPLGLVSKEQLDTERLEHELDQIDLKKKKKSLEEARKSLDREKQISEKNLLNTKEIQVAEADHRAAILEVEHSKIKLSSARSGLSSAQKGVQASRESYRAQSGGGSSSGSTIVVVAPISGVITERTTTLGQAIERTTEIVQIENLTSVWVTANVSEKNVSKARRGAAATVTVESFPGRIFHGVIEVVGSRLDPKTRTMPVQVAVENPDRALRADMFAKVNLGVGESSSALTVPEGAVLLDKEQAYVYTVSGTTKYKRVDITIGRNANGLTEVKSGLQSGQRVVVKGAFEVKSQGKRAELKDE